jgi:hypothetical protein
MNAQMTSTLHCSFTALIRRIRYRHGFPFITSVVLAVVTAAWPRFGRATSIWTFALLALISTVFALLCGARFRTFYIAIAVAPPFLFHLEWVLRMRPAVLDFPSKAVSEYFLYFVAAPILMVWMVAMLLNRKELRA